MYVTLAYVDVVIYRRQSRDDTGDELAVDRQGEDCAKLAALRGWTVAETITDNDLSASGRRRRPGFERMLTMVHDGRVAGVVAWDMTRLSRNRPDLVRLLETGEKRGITIALVRGTDLDLSTPSGQLTADILGAVARGETKVKSDRQRRAAEQAAAAGRPYVVGRRAFGFEQDGITHRHAEVAALRQAYDDLLHGVPLGRIARDLNARGLFTPQLTRAERGPNGEVVKAPAPSRWTAQTISPTLLNPRYAGLRARSVRPEHGRPKWEIICQAVWEPVVSEETWRAACSILGDPSRRTAPRSAQALLTGVALCGVCGSPVHGGRQAQGRKTYRCKAAQGHVVRVAEPVDEYVGVVVVERLSRPDAAELLADDTRPDAAELRSESQALRIRLDALATEFADGELTASQLRTATARLRARLDGVERSLADAGRVNVLGPVVGAEDVAAAWEGLDVDRRRAVIDLLMTVRLLPPGRGTRTFRPETVDIEPKR